MPQHPPRRANQGWMKDFRHEGLWTQWSDLETSRTWHICMVFFGKRGHMYLPLPLAPPNSIPGLRIWCTCAKKSAFFPKSTPPPNLDLATSFCFVMLSKTTAVIHSVRSGNKTADSLFLLWCQSDWLAVTMAMGNGMVWKWGYMGQVTCDVFCHDASWQMTTYLLSVKFLEWQKGKIWQENLQKKKKSFGN